MPTPEQIIKWAEKLELNPEEVSHWFRCKWRIKLMSPFLQGASNMPPSNNGSVTSTENGSYSRTDTGSDGAQGEKDNDDLCYACFLRDLLLAFMRDVMRMCTFFKWKEVW